MYLQKNTFIFLTLLASLILGCSPTNEQEEVNERPNVILIITDDQGYGDLAAHGNTLIRTPAMDALHKDAIRLTDFHVSPTCSPTRSALMTGRYNNRTGVWHTIGGWSLLRKNEKTLGDMFSEGGYQTGAFGKWHLGDNYPFRPFDRGFQETVMHGGGGVQQTPDYWGNDYFDDTYLKNGQPQSYDGYCTDVFFEEATHFIESHQEEPFFCYIATNAPHGPFNVPLKYYEQYAGVDDSLLLDYQRRFWGMITNIDDNLADLRQKLVDLNISDNTILIFMTDNGTAAGYRSVEEQTYGFNAGMRGTKGSQYDGGHRVPFFIYWPNGGLSGGKDVEALTAHIDVMPTLAELCNLELPQDHLPLDGKSLAPLLKGEDDSWEDRFLITDSQRIQVPEKWRKSAVMSNRWRLIDGEELYDIKADPGQKENLADEYPDQVTAMKQAYEDWWTSISTHFDDEPPILIGTASENPVSLTCHDWHTENEISPWNQLHIREGEKGKGGNGYWTVEIAEAGTYEIALSRYPIAADLGINATTPGFTTEEIPGIQRDIPMGKNLDFVSGWVKIGRTIEEKGVIEKEAKTLNFEVDLPAGKTTLTAGFTNAQGEAYGAYFVSLKKL